MFNLAIQDGTLAFKPYIPMLEENNVRQGFFEPEQYQSVLHHLPEDLRGVVTFGYLTGWRIQSEVLTLEWRQVNFETGEIRLPPDKSKNKKGRVFPMTADLRLVLQKQQTEHDRLQATGIISPWVFLRGTEQISTFKKAWKVAVKKAGCPGHLLHDLRRTAVRNFVRNGISERVAMKLTGHKTRSVFDRYDIVSGGDLLDAARKLDVAATAATAKQKS